MYRLLFRLVLRRFDPEVAHRWAFALIRLAAAVPPVERVLRRLCAAPAGGRLLDLPVPGLLGVAAGFDKDARGVRGLTMLGFGYVEVGTVTALAQPGNPRPRLFRVLDRDAIVNRMGFNNEGAAAVAARLARLRAATGSPGTPGAPVIGVNIGKSRVVEPADALPDYVASASALAPHADYLVVNVSSPNTPGLRDLQAVEVLDPLLAAVAEAADACAGRHVPLLVKIAPDLSDADVDAVADLVRERGLAGIVAVNTTIDHGHGAGGLSGPPLLPRGLAVVRRLRDRLGPGPTIIGVGGITTADDARAYLAAGASALQAYTAFIYRGPFWASGINRALARTGAGERR